MNNNNDQVRKAWTALRAGDLMERIEFLTDSKELPPYNQGSLVDITLKLMLADQKPLFVLTREDVLIVAREKGYTDDDITDDIIHQVQKGLEFGLEFWSEVMSAALDEAMKPEKDHWRDYHRTG